MVMNSPVFESLPRLFATMVLLMARRHTSDIIEASLGLHLRKHSDGGYGGNDDAFSGGTRSGGYNIFRLQPGAEEGSSR